jgi:WD40 repeat protein
VNPEGTLIATCSISGTRIKIFSAEDGALLQELRRGSTHALVTSIVFHPNLSLIACSSNKSTIHMYEIKTSIEKSHGGPDKNTGGNN